MSSHAIAWSGTVCAVGAHSGQPAVLPPTVHVFLHEIGRGGHFELGHLAVSVLVQHLEAADHHGAGVGGKECLELVERKRAVAVGVIGL